MMEDKGSGHQSDPEVMCLLRLRGEVSRQAKMKESYCNKAVFEGISTVMGAQGFKRSWLWCHCKIAILTVKHKVSVAVVALHAVF